jgi:hypothetical protein
MIKNFMQLNECQFFIFYGIPEKEISFYKPQTLTKQLTKSTEQNPPLESNCNSANPEIRPLFMEPKSSLPHSQELVTQYQVPSNSIT